VKKSWPDLQSALQGAGPVDVVEVFRRPEHVAAIVDDAIRLKVPALWLQDGRGRRGGGWQGACRGHLHRHEPLHVPRPLDPGRLNHFSAG
jgi:hypothetical protein